jgi:hypothetical protein
MDAFELLVGKLLEYEKFWVQHSVKVNLTISEKEKIGKKQPRDQKLILLHLTFPTTQSIF